MLDAFIGIDITSADYDTVWWIRKLLGGFEEDLIDFLLTADEDRCIRFRLIEGCEVEERVSM